MFRGKKTEQILTIFSQFLFFFPLKGLFFFLSEEIAVKNYFIALKMKTFAY